MDLENLQYTINQNLEKHLNLITPNHHIREVYKWAVLPPGKLFRPLLVTAIAADILGQQKLDYITDEKSDFSLLMSAIETHHSYTLVHDDLPAMDDDDSRRGKPSTHKEFGEWKALLVGDGLLSGSYRLLSKIKSNNLPTIFKFFSWATGPKGLIQGQVLDLSHEMKENFNLLKTTHEYKTARLIQTSILCSFLLASAELSGGKESHYRLGMNLLKLGHYTGIVFQLLDDLTELADKSLGEHENEINPWFNFLTETQDELSKGLSKIYNITKDNNLSNFSRVMSLYFSKIYKIVDDNMTTIEEHLLKKNSNFKGLKPVMSLLDRVR